MRTILRDLVRIALGAMLSVGLLATSASTIGLAQTLNGVSTINIPHQMTFQYPASWGLVLDSGRFPNNPYTNTYSTNEVIEVQSADGVASVFLSIYNDPGSAFENLQSLIGGDASDPTGHPSFRVVTPVAQAQVANADSSATADYVFTGSDGSVLHYYQLDAVKGAVHYRLEIEVDPDSQAPQYQSQINQIQKSFELLP